MSSELIKKIVLFLFVNALGFASSTANFFLGVQLGRFAAADAATIDFVQQKLFLGTSVTWIVCAVFSIGYFFFEGIWGKAFLWSAFILPCLYGLKVVLLVG